MSASATYAHDGGEIADGVRELQFDQPPLIIGSSWDREVAQQIGAYHLSIALPITDRLVLDRAYFGYRGGLRLIEDLYGAVLGSYQ